LDWLLSKDIDVVNVSMAGPPNKLLELALKKFEERGIPVVAAAGNGGPSADPMFPAAYEDVIAVTAVDAQSKAFRLANRGSYVDLAAPGVDVRHLKPGNGYGTSSGTSFAVPFVSTAVAIMKHQHPYSDPAKILFESAKDLGEPGKDDIYGYGLVSP
jgi:subtilisin family serine protease